MRVAGLSGGGVQVGTSSTTSLGSGVGDRKIVGVNVSVDVGVSVIVAVGVFDGVKVAVGVAVDVGVSVDRSAVGTAVDADKTTAGRVAGGSVTAKGVDWCVV